jgi:hypothetical protein
MMAGAWFIKWTRFQEKVHRRYFRLTPDCSALAWAPTPDASFLLSSSIRLGDVTSVDTNIVMDEQSGSTFYILTLWTINRTLQIGTEISDKFDVWYEALMDLTQEARNRNAAFGTRHGTMLPESRTAVHVAASAAAKKTGMQNPSTQLVAASSD